MWKDAIEGPCPPELKTEWRAVTQAGWGTQKMSPVLNYLCMLLMNSPILRMSSFLRHRMRIIRVCYRGYGPSLLKETIGVSSPPQLYGPPPSFHH